MKQDIKGFYRLGILSIMIFFLTYFFTYYAIYFNQSDPGYHAQIAEKLSIFHLQDQIQSGNTYFLWHLLVHLVFQVFGTSITAAASIVTGMVNVITICIVYFYYNFNKMDSTIIGGITFASLMVGPLFIPAFNEMYYIGQWSPNTWHNPTSIMVKPIGVLCVLIVIHFYNNKLQVTLKKLLFFSILLCLSVFAKPSFIQAFLPSIGIYTIISFLVEQDKKEKISCYIKFLMTLIPCTVILFANTFIIFFSGDTLSEGIGVSFFRVLSFYSDNPWLSLILVIAFPLYALILYMKQLKGKKDVQISSLYLVIAWGEMAFLYEKGPRELHVNFSWAFMLAVFCFWIVIVKYYFSEERIASITKATKIKKVQYIFGVGIFLCHFILGIWYYISYFTSMICS